MRWSFVKVEAATCLKTYLKKRKKRIVLIKTSIITERKPNPTEKTWVGLRKEKREG